MVMAASGLKSQSAYDHCQQRFHMLPLIRDVPSLGRCYSCIMVNPAVALPSPASALSFIPRYSSRLSG